MLKKVKSSTIILLLIISMTCSMVYGQVVNGYARGGTISGSDVNISMVDETFDTFEDGEYVFLIQLQDDVIGTTGNVVTFGDVGAINTAGRYEIRQIISHTESGGVPTQLTLDGPLTYAYNYGDNARYQVVTFPVFGAPDYTTVSDMEAKAWDGNTGGVLAFSCPGVLTLDHLIIANQKGYRGGTANGGSALGCTPGIYRAVASDDHANKGEGIYRINTTLNPEFVAARGRILNGGGGGNSHNGGGGGGGNYTAGGDGGPGWQMGGFCSPSAGGIGGYGLGPSDQDVISTTRLFMGGGGGAGEGNNALATDGGDGGGIVFVKAEEIRTQAGCSAGIVRITADGQASVLAAGNDGGGGGGAGGSIILQVNSFNIDCGCPLTVSANGGPGGNISADAHHGGGGGGGQGAIAFSNPTVPSGCVTIETNNGEGGCNNSSSPCNSQAGDGGGSNGDGILTGFETSLPAELGMYSAVCVDDDKVIAWETLSEINTDYFMLEYSSDNENWELLETINAAGWSSNRLYYSVTDKKSSAREVIYYRMTLVDLDGTRKVKFITSVESCSSILNIFPNPSTGLVTAFMEKNTDVRTDVYDMLGKRVNPSIEKIDERIIFDFSALSEGVYQILFHYGDRVERHSVVILAH